MRVFFLLTMCACIILVFGGFAYSRYAKQIEHFIEIVRDETRSAERRPLIQIGGARSPQNNLQVVPPPTSTLIIDDAQEEVVDVGVDEDEDEEEAEASSTSCPTNTQLPQVTQMPTRIPWFLPNFPSNAFIPRDILEPQTTLPAATPQPTTETPVTPVTLEPKPTTTRKPVQTPTPTFNFEILKRKEELYPTQTLPPPPQTTEPPNSSNDGMGPPEDDGMNGTPLPQPAPQPEPQPQPDIDSSSYSTVPPDSSIPTTPDLTPIPDNVFEVGSTLTKEEAKAVLAYHNEMRAKHQAPSLEWDSALARIAQKYVDTCPFGHSDTPYGENLAWGFKSMDLAAAAWYNEEFDFDNATLEEDSGHFTQMIWMDTKRIGCGQNMECKGPSNTERAFACYYDPVGNEMGVDWSTKVKRPIS
jgi:uncharacterized protein YkwD